MRHHRSAATVLTLLALLAAPGPVRAQEQTGAIEGALRDSHGGAVPGVLVTARGDSGLAVEATTGNDGLYVFPALPPGRYEVEATLTGFAPTLAQGVELRLGHTLTLDLVLEPASVSETVSVVAESPLISVTRSAHTTSLRGQEIDSMPRGREYTSLITQIAGVNDEPRLGGFSIDGASAAENRFFVDGVESSDLLNGLERQRVVTDFVDEIQVKSSGYSAEYGGSTGGVVQAVSRSGTNTWHGDLLLYWSGDVLDGGARPSLQLQPTDSTVAEYVTYPRDEYTRLEPGFTLGGPLLRDRVWLFAGYIPVFQPTDRTVTSLSDGVTRTYRQDERVDNLAANVTAQLGSRWRVRTAFNRVNPRTDGLLPKEDGSEDPTANYAVDRFRPRYTLSASVDFVPSSRVYMSLRASYYRFNVYDEGVYQGDLLWYGASSVGMPGVPSEYQQPYGYQNVPSNWEVLRRLTDRLGVQFDTTFFLEAAGRHQLKAGVQLDRLGLDRLTGMTGIGLDVYWGQRFAGQGGPYGYYMVWSNEAFPNMGWINQGQARSDNVGLFVQDSWTVGNRLTLNLGLRSENEHVPSFSSDPQYAGDAITWSFADKLAPRLGLAWDVRGDGRTKAYASWGIFYDIMKLALPFGLFGGQQGNGTWYTLDSPDLSAIENNDACPPACPGNVIMGPIDFIPVSNDAVADGLEPMKLQEAAVGLEQELGGSTFLSVRYVHKQLDRAVEDVGTVDEEGNEVFLIGNPGYGQASSFVPKGGTTALPYPRARREYDAVEVALNRRFRNGWSGRVSYTWSRLWGNYSGLSQSDEDGRVSPNVGRNFDYPLMSFDERGQPVYGVLPTDRTHQLKAQFVYDFDFGTTLGLNWFGASGIPRTRVAPFIPGHSYAVQYWGRNSDGRMPFVNRLDLYLQHQVRLNDRLRLAFSANVINLFDQATAINYFQDELLPGQPVAVDETEFYAGIDTQALIEEQGLRRDPRFLMDLEYQEPRSIRLGVKLTF
jgi:hypothetical protein